MTQLHLGVESALFIVQKILTNYDHISNDIRPTAF